VGKKIFIFGGNDRKSNYFNELYSFDTETRVWEKKVPNQRGCKPPVLSRHSAAAHGKKIYFFGGQNLENPFLNDTYAVDVGKSRDSAHIRVTLFFRNPILAKVEHNG